MNPFVPPDLDEQRRLVRRARAQGRRWVLRGILLAVIGVVGLYRGGGVNVTIGVACWVLALLSISLGHRTRQQAAELEKSNKELQQKLTELDLIKGEHRRLTTAVEQSPCVIIITNANGNIEYANPKFTQLTGYAVEEILGKKPNILKSGRNARSCAFLRRLLVPIRALSGSRSRVA